MPLRSSNHAPFTPLGQSLSEETIKAVSSFYLVSSRAGKVKKNHTRGIGGVNCRGLRTAKTADFLGAKRDKIH